MTTATQKKKNESLISRYHLEERAQTAEVIAEEQLGGKAVREDSAEKREASLRERKAQMILAARQCVSFLSQSFFTLYSWHLEFFLFHCVVRCAHLCSLTDAC